MSKVVIRATWDEEARVWFATSDDIQGLAVEAENAEKLQQKVIAAVEDLIMLNGNISLPYHQVPIEILSSQSAMAFKRAS